MAQLITNGHTWVWEVITVATAVLAGLIAHLFLYWFARRLVSGAALGTRALERSLIEHTTGPMRLVLPLATAYLVSAALQIEPGTLETVQHLLSLALIGALCWLALRLVKVFTDLVVTQYVINVQNDYRARSVRTQLVLQLERILTGAILVSAIAAILMTFPNVRSLGAGLFVAAAAAGLVVGIAARPTLANLLAGVQVALTEPIRIDDVVVVEGEYGRVEELTTTYAVIQTWDNRRIVVPLTYFVEKPFQNWTRTASNLLGTVFLYTDYMAPVNEIRRELERVVHASGLWDRKVWNLQVTDTKDRTLELRCTVSAMDPPALWDLRVEVREKMIRFLQENHPQSLPLTREMSGDSGIRALTSVRRMGGASSS